MSVPGASRFLGAATLANTRGLAAQQPTLLSQNSSAISLLDSGRSLAAGGFGLSGSARAVNQQLLSNSTGVNTLFSLGAATGASTDADAALTQIQALRSTTPDSQLSRAALAEKYGINTDDGGISESETGQEVDTEA